MRILIIIFFSAMVCTFKDFGRKCCMETYKGQWDRLGRHESRTCDWTSLQKSLNFSVNVVVGLVNGNDPFNSIGLWT